MLEAEDRYIISIKGALLKIHKGTHFYMNEFLLLCMRHNKRKIEKQLYDKNIKSFKIQNNNLKVIDILITFKYNR